MNVDVPQFSVILTCYNEERFIADAIDSVLNQTYIHRIKDIVITDDGSKDNSKNVILQKAKGNPVIKYLYQENKGLPSARNTAIQQTSGDYIAILDGDDLWYPDKIEILAKHIDEYPQVGLFYSNSYKYFYKTEKYIPIRVNKYYYNTPDLLKRFMANGGPVLPSTMCIKKECFNEVGLFDPQFRLGEDLDICLRIASKYPFHFIEDFLVKKRCVENSLGSSNVPANIVSYKKAFDKLENAVPGLQPYRFERETIFYYKEGLYYYEKKDWKASREKAAISFKRKKNYYKAYLLWAATYLKQFLNIDLIKLAKAYSN
jgi:glycosyltransferase involved in cell wall biosynthesis